MPDCIFADGSTITFDNGYSAVISQVGGFNRSMVTADVTPLNQTKDGNNAPTYRKMKVATTISHEPFTVQFYWNPDNAGLPPIGLSRECTITYPDNQKSLNGRGFIVGDNTGDLVSGEVVVGTYQFLFEGGVAVGDNPPDLA